MKILLASLSIEPDSRAIHSPNGAYSLGLAYLQSFLEKDGHEVRLLFLNNVSHRIAKDRTIKCIEEWQPQVVGFQIFSMNRISTYKVLNEMTISYPNTRVVLGGIHASVMYHQILERYPHAIIVIGEGELTLSELVKAFETHVSYDDVAGLAFFRDGKVVCTSERPLIKDLDVLPFPKHEMFFEEEPNRITAHIIASRGCPFSCSFCCLETISHRKWRKRNVAKVVEELKMLKEKYPRLQYVQFHDDTFLLDNERVILFCKLTIEANLSLKFICSARVKPISTEMFRWMKRAGFIKIMFGLETGSPALLKSIHKNIAPTDVLYLFKLLSEFDFDITTFLMCGFPGETDTTISETIALVRATQKIYYNYIAGIGKLWVYPGTEVYQIMKTKGCIDNEFWMTEASVPYFTVEHSFAKLVEFEERMMNELSVDRVFSLDGFRHQVPHMWREILGYLIRHPRRLIAISIPRQMLSLLAKLGRSSRFFKTLDVWNRKMQR